MNALADGVVSGPLKSDRQTAIAGKHLDQAAEALIKGRSTHVGSLLARLNEPRVIRVMDSVLSGGDLAIPVDSDDRQFCLDLGLLAETGDRKLRPACKIYEEVMSRAITDQIQQAIRIDGDPKKWVDGETLLMSGLLREFQKYWRQGSASSPLRHEDYAASKYDEATYSFILLSFLQRIVNSGGRVFREYAEGRGAVDICVRYGGNEYLAEVKLKGNGKLADWKERLAGYLDAAGQNEGWLVVFDRDKKKTWEERIYWEDAQFRGKTHVVGC